jgi:hypothetical protein
MSAKITKNTLLVEVGALDDPGDYPNSLASGPLPSRDVVEDVVGQVSIEWITDEYPLQFPSDEIEEFLRDELPDIRSDCGREVTVLAWDVDLVNRSGRVAIHQPVDSASNQLRSLPPGSVLEFAASVSDWEEVAP